MKTFEEFIKELDSSETLQNELKAVKDKSALAELLKKNDVSGTVEDFAETIKEKLGAEGEISDNAAEAVAGGDLFGSVWAVMRSWFA